MWNKTKILITGGAGMVAQSIAAQLQIYQDAILLMPTRDELNLEDKDAVRKYFEIHNPDYVFHLAGKVHGLGGNLLYPMETLSSNVLINDAVLSACQHDSVKKIFFAGTVASYKYPIELLPLKESDLFEGSPHAGEYGYAIAKRLAYSYLKILSDKFEKKWIYGVFTNLYGPGDRFNLTSGHVIPSLVMKLHAAKMQKKEFNVWGRPDSTRDFMFSHDAAAASIHLMENTDGIYNIGTGRETAMNEVVENLINISEFEGLVLWDSNKPVGISRRYSDVSKLVKSGYSLKYSLFEGLRDTWRWYENQISNGKVVRG